MKNLKQIAASFNLYQIEDIPETHKNDYRIGLNTEAIPDFLTKMDAIEVGLFYQCLTQDANTDKEIHYVEHSYILVKAKDSENLLMLRKDRNKKYRFAPYYSVVRKFQNISYHIKEKELKILTEPNLIGVFTSKKVTDWLTYCDEYLSVLNNCLNEVNKANNEIENKISDFIKSLPSPEIQTYENKTWVNTEKFQVIFIHYKDQNYLNTEITFKGSLQDITNIENHKS